MTEVYLSEIFDLKGKTYILDNFQKKIINNYGSIKEFQKNKLDEDKIQKFIKILINLGVNRSKKSLEGEIEFIGRKFDNLINYGALLLMSPKIYNIILEKITNRGNYSSYEALLLDLIFEILIPFYNYVKKTSNLTSNEIFCLIHGLLREEEVNSQSIPNILDIEDSFGFFESFSFFNISPYKEKLEKKENQFQESLKKESFFDVIKSKYQIEDLTLKNVTDTMNPMQRIFSPMGNIERIITSIKIRKKRIDDLQENNIEKAVQSIVRAMFELYSKEMVGRNKNFENFLEDISKNFSVLIEKSKDAFFIGLTNKIYADSARDIIKTATEYIKQEIIEYMEKFTK